MWHWHRRQQSNPFFRLVLIIALFALVFWAIASTRTTAKEDQYAGSEACKDCHEDPLVLVMPSDGL